MRTITFEERYSPDELAKALIEAGFDGAVRLDAIAAGRVNDEVYDGVDDEIALECVVDEDDVVDALGDEAILNEAAKMAVDGANARNIEDAVRYVRAGDMALAGAMFARVFEGEDLRAAERALS